MRYLFFFLILLLPALLRAQAPLSFSYSGMAFDSQHHALADDTIHVEVRIKATVAGGAAVYTETHTAITSTLGLFSISMGNGTPSLGNFASIAWQNDVYFFEVLTATDAGSALQSLGIVQFLSVPYAIHTLKTGQYTGDILEADAFFTGSVSYGITENDTIHWNNDTDPENEMQLLSISNDTVYLSDGGFVVLPATHVAEIMVSPVISTDSATRISSNTADFYAHVSGVESFQVIEKGFVYSTAANPNTM